MQKKTKRMGDKVRGDREIRLLKNLLTKIGLVKVETLTRPACFPEFRFYKSGSVSEVSLSR